MVRLCVVAMAFIMTVASAFARPEIADSVKYEREFGITKALTAVLKRDIDYQVTRSGRLIFYRRVYRQKTSCPLDSGTS